MIDKKSEEEKVKREAEKEEKLKAIDPKAALKGLVDEAVRQAVGVVKMEEDSGMEFVPIHAAAHDHAGDLIAAMQPKNGSSPGGALGSNSKKDKKNKKEKTIKGKGKSKGQVQVQENVVPDQSIGKFKGKGKGNGRKWKVWKPAQKAYVDKKQAFVPNQNAQFWQRGWQNRWPQWTWNKQNQWASRGEQAGGKGKSNGW